MSICAVDFLQRQWWSKDNDGRNYGGYDAHFTARLSPDDKCNATYNPELLSTSPSVSAVLLYKQMLSLRVEGLTISDDSNV